MFKRLTSRASKDCRFTGTVWYQPHIDVKLRSLDISSRLHGTFFHIEFESDVEDDELLQPESNSSENEKKINKIMIELVFYLFLLHPPPLSKAMLDKK